MTPFRTLACGLAVFTVSGALAQGSAPAAAKADPKRVADILSFTKGRMNHQIDIWFDQGDYMKAIQALRHLVEVDPGNYEIVTNLGYLLRSVNKGDEELAYYIRFRKENPTNPDSSYPEAEFYFRNKLYVKVPPLLEPVLGKKP